MFLTPQARKILNHYRIQSQESGSELSWNLAYIASQPCRKWHFVLTNASWLFWAQVHFWQRCRPEKNPPVQVDIGNPIQWLPVRKNCGVSPTTPMSHSVVWKLMAPQAGKKKLVKWAHGAGPFSDKPGQVIPIPGKRLHGGTKKLKKCDHSESNSRDQVIEKLAITPRLKELTMMSPRVPLSPSPPDWIFIIIIYFWDRKSVV